MNKEKQIEEMAIIIDNQKEDCNRIHNFGDCKVCKLIGKEKGCVFGEHIAEALYKAGYRKIKKGSIIIEQYIPKEGIKVKTEADVRKETAKEILQELYDKAFHSCYGELPYENIIFLARKYGIETKEWV